MKRQIILILLAISAVALWTACENDYPDSVFTWEYTTKPKPAITALEPAGGTFAGIGRMKIVGQNLSTVLAENHVFFNGQPGTIHELNGNEMIVQCANVVGDSVKIQLRVDGAYELYTHEDGYKLETAVIPYKAVTKDYDITGLCVDKDENLYALRKDGTQGRIIKMTSTDSTTFEEIGKAAFSIAYGMKVGPNGTIFVLRNNTIIYRLPAGSNKDTNLETFARVKQRVSDLDFDQNGNLFVGGSGKVIYRVNPTTADTMTVATYTDNNIVALRVYNGFLYVVTDYTGTNTSAVQEGIYRNQILDSDGHLGPAELMFDWAAYSGGIYGINTITFDQNGILFAGLDGGNAISAINLATGVVTPYYTEVLTTPSSYFAWGNSYYLYVNRHNNEDETKRAILRVAMSSSVGISQPIFGAPTYGRD